MDDAQGDPASGVFSLFYAIDCELYTVLVRDLSRNPSSCLHIMGLWLWFEHIGITDVISKILALSIETINQLADEALTCLDVIETTVQFSPASLEIPLTRTLLETDLFVRRFRESRATVFYELHMLVNNIYIPVLSNLLERAFRGGFGPSLTGPSSRAPEENLARIFSGLTFGEGMSARLENEMSRIARTMFAIFSEGSPVTEPEIRQYFTTFLANCIDSVRMHEARPGGQPVYAQIRFLRPSFVQTILNGQTSVRHVINGKTVWMRQNMPRIGPTLPCGCPARRSSMCPHRGA